MKTSRRTVIASCSALVGLVLLCSCQKQAPLSPEVLARVGDCGFLTRDSTKVRWEHTVREAAFALKQKNEISPVIRAADGFYLLKLIDHQAARTAPLPEVRERIEKQLLAAAQKQARARFSAELRRGLSVEINQPLLHSLEAPCAPVRRDNAAPPATPGQ